MYDQTGFNQLLHDPNVTIYHLPTIANTENPGNTKYTQVNQIDYVKTMLTNLNYQYQNTQSGLAYYTGDVDIKKLQPIQNDYFNGFSYENGRLRFDEHAFKNYVNKLNIQNQATLPPDSYTDHYLESDQFVDQIFGHQYQNMPDHLFLFTIFYDDNDDRQTPTIAIHSDSLYNDWSFSSWNSNDHNFENVFVENSQHHSHNPVDYAFLNHNQVYGVDDLKTIENITHQTIDIANQIIEQCQKIDPQFKVRLAQQSEYLDRDWINERFNTVNDWYPALLQDLLLPYDQNHDRLVLTPQTWLDQCLNPFFEQLATTQQQDLLFKIANILFAVYDNHNEIKMPYQSGDSYQDQLINNGHLKINNDLPEALPIMNHNDFVQQLSQLADETTIVKTTNPNISEQKIPVTNFKFQLTTPKAVRFNELISIAHNAEQKFNTYPYTDYYRDFTIQWHHEFIQRTHESIGTYNPDVFALVGFIKTNKNKLTNILQNLPDQLKDHNYVINWFSFKSGIVDIVIQKTTQLNQFNFIVLPDRIMYQDQAATIDYQLAQTNLSRLTSITNQRIDLHDSHDLNVSNVNSHLSYEKYNYLILDRLYNDVDDYDASKNRNRDRIKAVKNNPAYQAFITKL